MEAALVKATGTGSLYKAGTYDLSLTSADDSATFSGATLDGVPMVLENGIFKGDSTNTLGINIEPSTGAPDTKIYIGASLIQSLRDFSKTVLTQEMLSILKSAPTALRSQTMKRNC